ncbi:hypothetical protein SKM62_04335 [Acinetobacter faecalis]|uniref:Lysozyme inhibitor LprI-like N-terminal domain-containing protein n=2 Tax=Moraxellaceae TaxID=468 RepID=A0A6L6GCZ0_9GAMM|nr:MULTISPECIES: lysozyme inhibitor LprI family protein [Acinetobacter]MDY6488238.1 hypothetical protein [Acinetobacter faecalis]MDY6529937.1 hypothetical protein [Acinetobacter faecalis]MDY6536163.1 hypothetical protein [Acinetobacter faecalis]MTD10335.1 hypothetical protein [Acinetobacter faecalis]WFP97052.1 hypothetical protein P3S51_01420 [Acinetobacter sp. ANC 7201]
MKIFIKHLLMIMSLSLTQTYAASFDCNHAKTSTEHAICESLAVNDADVKMATTYKIVNKLVPMGTRSVIRDEQVKWLAMRDRCGKAEACLNEVYKMRQQQLDIYLQRIYQKGPF